MKCIICKEEKDNYVILYIQKEFRILCDECKEIIKQEKNEVSNEEYIQFIKNKKKEYNKNYKINHVEEIKKSAKKYRDSHKEQIKQSRQKNKDYMKNYNKEYREKNKEKLAEKRKKKYYETHVPRKKVDIELKKIKSQTRCLINKCFVRKGFKKNTKTEKILGCDFETFYRHLLKTFKDNYGYEWDNCEKVEIDHIIPLKSAKSEKEVVKLCHYTNLQLLKSIDNKRKSSKII